MTKALTGIWYKHMGCLRAAFIFFSAGLNRKMLNAGVSDVALYAAFTALFKHLETQ